MKTLPQKTLTSPSSPKPATAAKHPNTRGEVPRTRLAGGPFVDTTTTLAKFAEWAARGVSQGVVIDRLTDLAVKIGFDPVEPAKSSDEVVTLMAVKTREATNAAEAAAVKAAATPEKANPAAPKRKRG